MRLAFVIFSNLARKAVDARPLGLPDADDPGRVPEIGFVLGAPYKLARRVGSALGLNASASTAASRRTVRRAIFERLERLMPLVHQAGRIDIFRVHLREFALAGDDPDDALEVLSDSSCGKVRARKAHCLVFISRRR